MTYKVFLRRNIPGTLLFLYITLVLAYSLTSFNNFNYQKLLPLYVTLTVCCIVCMTRLSVVYLFKLFSAIIYILSLWCIDAHHSLSCAYFVPVTMLNIFYLAVILYPVPSEEYEDGGYPSITTSLISTMHWRLDDGEFELV